ncbi:unnamed protein product [Caenorhabditis angaria]|uniref:Uncharacterized protein n=1 Tax=Caenorhabditis angaria TaxID=860376 RepID=A0A9P1J2L3_9PELO|nr:unnamed protein product [Caenorhabditis angaria]
MDVSAEKTVRKSESEREICVYGIVMMSHFFVDWIFVEIQFVMSELQKMDDLLMFFKALSLLKVKRR